MGGEGGGEARKQKIAPENEVYRVQYGALLAKGGRPGMRGEAG